MFFSFCFFVFTVFFHTYCWNLLDGSPWILIVLFNLRAGGIPARNSKGERLLLFLGIIDILQSYRLKKKLEHTWKSMLHDGVRISFLSTSFLVFRCKSKVLQKVMHLHDIKPHPLLHLFSSRLWWRVYFVTSGYSWHKSTALICLDINILQCLIRFLFLKHLWGQCTTTCCSLGYEMVSSARVIYWMKKSFTSWLRTRNLYPPNLML